jgi:hypothetical protein
MFERRYSMKILLAILGCVSLCSCELAPSDRDSASDSDRYLAPGAQIRSGLADPRTYMDKPGGVRQENFPWRAKEYPPGFPRSSQLFYS